MEMTGKLILSAVGVVFLSSGAVATPIDMEMTMPRYAPAGTSSSTSSWIQAPMRQNLMHMAQQEKFPPIGFDPSRPDASYNQPEVSPVWPAAPSASEPPAFALPKLAAPLPPPAAPIAPAPQPSSSGLYGKTLAPQPPAGFAGMPQPGAAPGFPPPLAAIPAWGQPGHNPWARPKRNPRPRPATSGNPWRGYAGSPASNARPNPWASPPANTGNVRNGWGQNAFNRIAPQPVAPRYANPWPPKAQNPASSYNYGYPSQFRNNGGVNATNRESWNFNGAYPNFGWGGGAPW